MSGPNEHHIVPLKTFLGVFATLMFLTVMTVVVAQFHFGAWNTVVAMAIASLKAFFVLAYFMHLKYDDKVFLVGFLLSIFFLIVMYFFSVLDISTRPVLNGIL
ncbi:MAG TPA: hypothetical protein DCL41_03790 [Bdellovibrionales bacterium]|nr:hypothetical protein [Pseudobdellovibrionaceae bacterium]HAG90964.1 hypothetical protein [Bdellovibrionales bacterium]|tara:strand:+ start:3395 stop:3703 length:309 start_codon:yes stop_codon:yes gene_type:complete